MVVNGLHKNELPVYPADDGYESRVFNADNTLVAVVVGGDKHFERACLVAHLINDFYGVKPTHYYPLPQRLCKSCGITFQFDILSNICDDCTTDATRAVD